MEILDNAFSRSGAIAAAALGDALFWWSQGRLWCSH
jgi:hypothetical protein